MAVGTTAAIIGLMAASAGSSAVKGAMQSRAAGKAAKAADSAINRSIDTRNQLWNMQQQYQQPYLAGGGQSMNLLSSLMTPGNAPGAYRPGNDYRIQQPQMPGPPRAMGRNAAMQQSRPMLADIMGNRRQVGGM